MEQTAYSASPAMFRNDPLKFILCCLLCLVIVGIPIMLTWWLRCKGTLLTVTNERTTLRRGILSKETNEIMHSNVRNIQIRQSFFQRIFDTGYVGISSAGQSGMEIEVWGIPSPEEIKKVIDQNR